MVTFDGGLVTGPDGRVGGSEPVGLLVMTTPGSLVFRNDVGNVTPGVSTGK